MASVRNRELAVSVMSVPPPHRLTGAFDRWIAGTIEHGAAVLNIGAGCNLSGQFPRTRQRAAKVVGVDPSERIHLNRSLDERHQATMQQFAADRPAEFDAAFSVFVLEHVTDPVGFTAACARTIRPGGHLFALTVNKWHYFGLSTWAATRLGISDWLLPKVRPVATVERYHFPTAYRMNTVHTVSRLLADAGFRSVEFRMWDLPKTYTPYLPHQVEGIAGAWNSYVYRHDWPQAMGHLTFKATR